jgi:microcystin-dependent protein
MCIQSATTILRCAVISALILCSPAQESGHIIPFQGQLADQAGQPLSPSKPLVVVFRLYRVPVGGVPIWEESQSNISVNAGRFSVLLGSRTELPGPTNFNSTLYLGMTVDDGNPATVDVEMRPRQALVPVISASYAKQAQNADKLNGFDWSALFGVNNPQGKILGSRIAPGTVSSNEIAPQTITASQIEHSTITAEQIARNTIKSDQIADATLTAAKMSAQLVIDALIPPGTITAFGGAHIPEGWLLCDGRHCSSVQYPRLFAAIERAWGEADFNIPGATNDFALPDLRGLFLRGVDNSPITGISGNDPDRTGRTTIHSGGNTGNAVGSFQNDKIKDHTHNFHQPTPLAASVGGNVDFINQVGALTKPTSGVNDQLGGNETRPKNAYVNYIIKY